MSWLFVLELALGSLEPLAAAARGFLLETVCLDDALSVDFRDLCFLALWTKMRSSSRTISRHVGRQMKVRKPICEDAMAKPSRSHRGETFRPISFSSSPCAWNSSVTRLENSSWILQSFAEWLMSAARKSMQSVCCWSAGTVSGSKPSAPRRTRKAERSARCCCVSVARISSIMSFRACDSWSAVNPDSTFFSDSSPCSSSRSRINVAVWKFSSTLLSL
mmetsp:Transcript_69804/g.150371  ORF Transcript_69804/g.150371 Transcript_69804/m.150371 type:complete len:219 (-) Transcript_69804:418-1074(-)